LSFPIPFDVFPNEDTRPNPEEYDFEEDDDL